MCEFAGKLSLICWRKFLSSTFWRPLDDLSYISSADLKNVVFIIASSLIFKMTFKKLPPLVESSLATLWELKKIYFCKSWWLFRKSEIFDTGPVSFSYQYYTLISQFYLDNSMTSSLRSEHPMDRTWEDFKSVFPTASIPAETEVFVRRGVRLNDFYVCDWNGRFHFSLYTIFLFCLILLALSLDSFEFSSLSF